MREFIIGTITLSILIALTVFWVTSAKNAVQISAKYCISKGMDVQKIGGWGGIKACVDGNGTVHPIPKEGI